MRHMRALAADVVFGKFRRKIFHAPVKNRLLPERSPKNISEQDPPSRVEIDDFARRAVLNLMRDGYENLLAVGIGLEVASQRFKQLQPDDHRFVLKLKRSCAEKLRAKSDERFNHGA